MPWKPKPKNYKAFDGWLDQFDNADEALAKPSMAKNGEWTGLQKQHILDFYVEEEEKPTTRKPELVKPQKLSGKERRKLKKQRRKERELKEKRKRSKQ